MQRYQVSAPILGLNALLILVKYSCARLHSSALNNSVAFRCGFRESIYRLLPQTTPENVSKNFSQYSLDPTTRYPNISLNFLKPSQVGAPLGNASIVAHWR